MPGATGIVSPDNNIGRRRKVIVILSILLFLLPCLLAVRSQVYLVWLVPLFLLLLMVAFIRIDLFFLTLLFLTPLSVQLRFLLESPPVDIFLPTELMLLLVLIIMIFRIFHQGDINRDAVSHPISIVVLLMLIWMLITSLTGTMILVSIKYFLARLWFVTAFYFLAMELFARRKFIKRALLMLILGMTPVVIYHIIGLSRAGIFNQEAAHITMWPFFNDHTSFGAALALLIPVVGWMIKGREKKKAVLSWIFFSAILLIFVAGFILSYSRAAWISLIIATCYSLLLMLRIPMKFVIASGLLGVVLVFFSWNSIITTLGGQQQSSSGNIKEHFSSVANITSDASNLERINRWKSALRMVSERPFLGWGPGTYQFRYAPYQFSYERTSISTNFGDHGNAHSEYLGSAVDSGIPGALIFGILVVTAMFTGYRSWLRAGKKKIRWMILSVQAALLTYIIHAFLNNFLDTDKISAPFWSFIAIIVVTDLKLKRGESRKNSGYN